MNTIDKNYLINHGFTEDTDKKVLSRLFTKHSKFKELDVSVNLTEPCMLLARSKEKNVTVELNCAQDNCLILKRKRNREKFDTVIMNVLLDEINFSGLQINSRFVPEHTTNMPFGNNVKVSDRIRVTARTSRHFTRKLNEQAFFVGLLPNQSSSFSIFNTSSTCRRRR